MSLPITRHYSSLYTNSPYSRTTSCGIMQGRSGKTYRRLPPTCIVLQKPVRLLVLEWNDIRDKIGTNVGVYDNPTDFNG